MHEEQSNAPVKALPYRPIVRKRNVWERYTTKSSILLKRWPTLTVHGKMGCRRCKRLACIFWLYKIHLVQNAKKYLKNGRNGRTS